MSFLHAICEEIRDAIDDEGAKGCFKKSVERYSRATGIPIDGLWAGVEGVLQGSKPDKLLKRLQKSWGGTPDQWVSWIKIVRTKPDCPEAR